MRYLCLHTLLKQVMPWIGHLPLERIHRGVLQPYVDARREAGRTAGTINHGLKIVRRVLNLAAQEWMDEYGLTWRASAPKVKLLPDTNKRPTLGRAEQALPALARSPGADGTLRRQHRVSRW